MCSEGKGIGVAFLIGISFLIGLFPENGLPQEPYPTKPITIFIQSGAGGMADTTTRVLCKGAEKELGRPIICENKPGAGGTICKNYVIRSKPDGYTIAMASTSTDINTPHMQKVPYNVLTDMTEIMVYLQSIQSLCVRADAPWNTFEDVLAYARQNPGKFTYATAGVGFTQHICMERIAMREGIKWSMVPFKSGSEAVIACLGGHTNAVAQGPVDVIPHIEAGKLKMLSALNDKRWPIAPNIPTVLEKYGFYGMSFQYIYGPKGISEPIREKLQNAFKKAMSDPSYVELAKSHQVMVVYMNGKDYEKLWKSEYGEMGKIIRALGLGN